MHNNNNEQLPVQITNKILMGKKDVRVILLTHPVNGEIAPSVPLNDYADAFSYDRSGIRQMIERTKWLKKHTCEGIIPDHLGRFQPHICIFEETMLGLFMKIQPSRCKDPEVAIDIEEIQEELITLLKDALKNRSSGDQTKTEWMRYRLQAQKAKDVAHLTAKIENMKDGPFKDYTIEALEKLTGKQFPKSAQMKLPLK